jgi:tetratricopeptide (TPR) repeat protein
MDHAEKPEIDRSAEESVPASLPGTQTPPGDDGVPAPPDDPAPDDGIPAPPDDPAPDDGIPAPPDDPAPAQADEPDSMRLQASSSKDAQEQISPLKSRLRQFQEKFFVPLLLVTVTATVLGLASDLIQVGQLAPWRSNGETTRLTAPYNIAVAGFAMDTSETPRTDREELGNFTADVQHSFFEYLSDRLRDPGLVAIGQPIQDIPTSFSNRTSRISELRDEGIRRNADIVISGVVRGGPRAAIQLEFYIGGNRLGEAVELTGYHLVSEINLAGMAVATPARETAMFLARADANWYVSLLKAVGDYATGNYEKAVESLARLTKHGTTPQRLVVLLLIGNSWGRLDHLEKSAHSYNEALKLDPEYPRAKLGSIEIRYQSTIRRNSCSDLTEDEQQQLARTEEMYAEISKARYAESDIPDVDARASFGIGRVRLCRMVAGSQTDFDLALESFKFVASRYETHPDHVWLRTMASDAHANIGLAYRVGDRGHPPQLQLAAKQYQEAIGLATDSRRVEKYTEILRQIRSSKWTTN